MFSGSFHLTMPPTLPSSPQLSGLVLLGMGVWIMYGAATFVQVMGSFSVHLVTLSYICIGVGGVLALLGTVGYLGAKKENRCLILLVSEIIGQ